MARFVSVGGLSGVGFLVLGAVVPELVSTLPDWVRYTLVGVGGALIFTSWLWWLLNKGKGDADEGGVAQTTHGPHSPNYSKVEGGVHNYFAPPPAAPEPVRTSRPRGYARIDAMRRCPEMPISEALAYLTSLGRSREEARRTLQQAFRDQRMEVWGRAEITPRHLSAPFSAQETWERVHPHYWTEFKLSEEAFDADGEQPQTVAQDHVRKRVLRRYWSLRVSREQLKEEWPAPRPPERDDDGLNWKTV